MRRFLIVIAALAVLAILHPWLLPWLAGALVVDQTAEGCTHVWLCGGDRSLDEAERLCQEDPRRRLMLVETRPERVHELGIEPTFQQLCLVELKRRGVPASAIELVAGDAENDWQAVRCVSVWMEDQPADCRLLVLTNRFGSRRRSVIIDRVATPEQRTRIHVGGLPDRRYDESDWWRTRGGVREVLVRGLGLLHVCWSGEPARTADRWDPDAYERDLVQRAGGG